MTDSPPETDQLHPTKRRPEELTPALAAKVVLSEGRTAKCTLYPRGDSEYDRQTAWIAADGDSFVSIEEMR